MLDLLDDLVNPGGIVVFAAEPIWDAFYAPWGIRSDGQTLWSIRKFGWMELGFKETYFRQSLRRRGWAVEKYSCDASSIAIIFIASRSPQGSPDHEPLAATATEMQSDRPDELYETADNSAPIEALITVFKALFRPITPVWLRKRLLAFLKRI